MPAGPSAGWIKLSRPATLRTDASSFIISASGVHPVSADGRSSGVHMLRVYCRASRFRLSSRVVRLGFIIGFIALLGALLSGLAAYRVHDQELALDRIALARAIDVHASLVQDRLTERELLARVASGLFRAPSVIKPNMLEPLRSAIYAFKTDFVVAGWIARLKPNELAAAQAAIAGAGFPNPRIRGYDDKPIDPASVTQPIDVLMDLEPRSDETRALPGRSYDQDPVRSAMLTRARIEKRSVASDPVPSAARRRADRRSSWPRPSFPRARREPAGFVTFSYELASLDADQ